MICPVGLPFHKSAYGCPEDLVEGVLLCPGDGILLMGVECVQVKPGAKTDHMQVPGQRCRKVQSGVITGCRGEHTHRPGRAQGVVVHEVIDMVVEETSFDRPE